MWQIPKQSPLGRGGAKRRGGFIPCSTSHPKACHKALARILPQFAGHRCFVCYKCRLWLCLAVPRTNQRGPEAVKKFSGRDAPARPQFGNARRTRSTASTASLTYRPAGPTEFFHHSPDALCPSHFLSHITPPLTAVWQLRRRRQPAARGMAKPGLCGHSCSGFQEQDRESNRLAVEIFSSKCHPDSTSLDLPNVHIFGLGASQQLILLTINDFILT